jgi:hypothetical protein
MPMPDVGLEPLMCADHAPDRVGTDNLAAGRRQWQDGQQYVDALAIVAEAGGVVVAEALTGHDPPQSLVRLTQEFGSDHEPENRLPNRFGRAVSEDRLGRLIPTGNQPG